MAVNEKLGVTLASKPKFPELDRTAQQLKAILDVYLPEWVELERYNQAKKYEIDDGEKGKKLLFSYLEAQERFDNAYRQFAAQLKTVEVIEREKRMANYKKEGRLLALYTEESLTTAYQILALFEREKDLEDKAKTVEADKLMIKLESRLAEMKKFCESGTLTGKTKKTKFYVYESIYSSLIDFTKKYHKIRKTNKVDYYNEMVYHYNDATENYNRM